MLAILRLLATLIANLFKSVSRLQRHRLLLVEISFMPGLSELSERLVCYVERTFAHVVEFVQGLTEVKDIFDLTKLQTKFIEAQTSAMSELVRDLGEVASKPMMRNLKALTSAPAQVTITRKHLASALAERHGMAKKPMDKLLSGAIALIAKHIKNGDRVWIGGLGTFQVRTRAARVGRNPATGERIAVKASKTVSFRPSKELRAEFATSP
jgi:DNA-binding protein HU-beta